MTPFLSTSLTLLALCVLSTRMSAGSSQLGD